MPTPRIAEAKPGEKYGRWTVLAIYERSPKRRCLCICICGTFGVVYDYSLWKGISRSCGCLKTQMMARTGKHWMRQSPEYAAWAGAKGRCHNKTDPQYERYGARGITMCALWRCSFVNFYADLGPRPKSAPGMKRSHYSLERINNDMGYEPGNCKWASRWEQMANTRVSTAVVFNGVTYTVGRLARLHGIWPQKLASRLKDGFTVEEALAMGQPKRSTRKR